MAFRILGVLILTMALAGCGQPRGPMTPYAAPGNTVQGMTYEPGADFDGDLQRMRDDYFVNTVNIYGLQDWPATRLDALFATLTRLDLRLVVRLEAYDPQTFAFTDDDARRVVDQHAELLKRTRGNDRVAYLAVNMPVDDRRVQDRLGGINSSTSTARQVTYAQTVTGLIRERTDAKVFLGLFYGWDGSYAIPSYRDSGADGYVLTNYSYPGSDVAGNDSDTAELIGESRLHAATNRAVTGQPGKPIVVEYGFQTLTGHRDRPDQSAGLVRDDEAKRAALRATTRFYREHYPAVIGTIYFGYNVHKVEGNPPRIVDYGVAAAPMPA